MQCCQAAQGGAVHPVAVTQVLQQLRQHLQQQQYGEVQQRACVLDDVAWLANLGSATAPPPQRAPVLPRRS
jgi:hypothetical protein